MEGLPGAVMVVIVSAAVVVAIVEAFACAVMVVVVVDGSVTAAVEAAEGLRSAAMVVAVSADAAVVVLEGLLSAVAVWSALVVAVIVEDGPGVRIVVAARSEASIGVAVLEGLPSAAMVVSVSVDAEDVVAASRPSAGVGVIVRALERHELMRRIDKAKTARESDGRDCKTAVVPANRSFPEELAKRRWKFPGKLHLSRHRAPGSQPTAAPPPWVSCPPRTRSSAPGRRKLVHVAGRQPRQPPPQVGCPPQARSPALQRRQPAAAVKRSNAFRNVATGFSTIRVVEASAVQIVAIQVGPHSGV